MARHVLKCWPEFFEAVASGAKTFEIRRNDRDFQVGDVVDLCEYDPKRKRSTGEVIPAVITYVFRSSDMVAHTDETGTKMVTPISTLYCVFSFRVLPDPQGAPI